MDEREAARQFGQRAGQAAQANDWVRARNERDAFRIWCFLIAPGFVGHDMRIDLEKEFDNAYEGTSGKRSRW